MRRDQYSFGSKWIPRLVWLALVIGTPALQAEFRLGVSPRRGKSGPDQLARWEGRGTPVPAGWKGSRAELIGISLGGSYSWGSLAEYSVNYQEDERGWKDFDRKDRMEIAVPMFPDGTDAGPGMWTIALTNKIPNPGINADDGANERQRFEAGGLPYLTYFEKLAENLVRTGYGKSILRLGWEFNGHWFPWGTQVGNFEIDGEKYDHQRAYRELYRAIHDRMMSVEGAQFRWSWSVSIGGRGFVDADGKPVDYIPYFPGGKIVDFVSVDYFDDEVRYYPGDRDGISDEAFRRLTWLSHLLRVEGLETSLALLVEKLGADMKGHYPWAASGMPRPLFQVLESDTIGDLESLRKFVVAHGLAHGGRPGVQWFRDFAARQELGFIVSEWGVWENNPHEQPRHHFTGGDNPLYIELFHQWLQDNQIPGQLTGALYFEEFNDLKPGAKADGFNHSLLESFPKSRQRFIELFQSR